MTPRQLAILKNAAKTRDGFVDHDDSEDMEWLCDQGYLVEMFGQTCEITAEGKEALCNEREW